MTCPSSGYADAKSEIAMNLMSMRMAEIAPTRRTSSVDERLVQAIWHEQLLRSDRLVTCSGKPVRVVEPGDWNGESGPDFRHAELEIDGRRIRGDVEIHLNAADWERHRHDRDFEYNSVVLHAFLWRDDTRAFDPLHNGGCVERIELASAIDPDLETVRRSLSGDDYPLHEREISAHCAALAAHNDENSMRRFFVAAGRERIEEKIARFAAHAHGETDDQVLYQAIMTAMGHKGGKTLFFLLAKRTPIEELKVYLKQVDYAQLATALEAMLLHVANLVPQVEAAGDGSCAGPALDAEAQTHLDQLHRWWSELAGYFEDRVIPPTRRWFGGIRPVNFPTRRIAGVARLLAGYEFRNGLLKRFADATLQSMARQPRTARDFKREIAQLSLIFSSQGDSFWSRRFTWTGKKSARAMQLIGDDRAASVFFNALLPMLLLHARRGGNAALEEYLWRIYEHFPALPENSVTRFMVRRLFGDTRPKWLDPKFEKWNQALIHVFHDCCNNNALTCDDCCFGSA